MTIIIHPYDPRWPQQFDTIRRALHQVLGPLAERIDHIGSTAVPGLAAKDIIDVQVTVRTLDPTIPPKMVAAGYPFSSHRHDHVPPGEQDDPHLWSKFLFQQPEGKRRSNIHVRVAGNPNQRYALLFRDYLRSHSASARTIEAIKYALARYHPEDPDAYYDIKDPVYDLIWEAAKAWAAQNSWKPLGEA